MKNKSVFIIEHLEPKFWPWCFIEYKNISKIVGKRNLWFTNIKSKTDIKKLRKYGKVMKDSIKNIKLNNACVLDPEAKKILNHREVSKFNYFIFGGILGDYPPRKRTKLDLSGYIKNSKTRNLGKEQMSTDNAVYAVKAIVNGKNLKDLKFKDNIEININKIESIILPYKCVIINEKPLISPELLVYLKKNIGI